MDSIPTLENVGGLSSSHKSQKDVCSSRLPAKLKNVNAPLLATLLLLVGYGLMICTSAISGNESYSLARQLAGLAIGIVICIVLFRFNYQLLRHLTVPLLAISVILILSPHIPGLGVSAMGAKSWIKLGMQFQPGEFAKVTVILFAASLVAKYGGKIDLLKEYCKVVGLLAIPFICILTQPDLGTGLVYLVISAVVLICGGAKMRYIIATILVIVGILAAILLIDEIFKVQASDGTYQYKLLKNYQRNRLFVFLNQGSADASSEAYNLNQAMIAIGSGGAFGKGLGASTQSSLGFLPEAPTDFIFCVLAEELGFVGVFALLALYATLLFLTIRIAFQSGDMFGLLICIGISAMWLFQILENVGMCCGVMPITGIPLPFVSYGSSFMIVNFACVGLVASVWRNSNVGGGSHVKSKGMKHASEIK